jgi:hypothetical protein
MCTEASAVLRAVAADFFFNCWYLEIPSDNRMRHILCTFTMQRSACTEGNRVNPVTVNPDRNMENSV